MYFVRQAGASDISHLLELQAACYPTLSTVSAWYERHLRSHQRNFPEGQLAVETEDGRIVAMAASFMVRHEAAFRPHTFSEITERGTFDRHDPEGDALYGAEIMVHPDHRRRGIGRLLYEARQELIRRRGLHYFVAGGRLPGFSEASADTSVEDYVRDVVESRRDDRVLTPQLRSGMRVHGILPNYLNDPKSMNFASLIAWENPDWRPAPAHVPQPSLRARARRAGDAIMDPA